jgi:hypothetical protein
MLKFVTVGVLAAVLTAFAPMREANAWLLGLGIRGAAAGAVARGAATGAVRAGGAYGGYRVMAPQRARARPSMPVGMMRPSLHGHYHGSPQYYQDNRQYNGRQVYVAKRPRNCFVVAERVIVDPYGRMLRQRRIACQRY